jgi:hypothetical protein
MMMSADGSSAGCHLGVNRHLMKPVLLRVASPLASFLLNFESLIMPEALRCLHLNTLIACSA